MRFLRKSDAFWDSYTGPDEPQRSEALREIVDKLPAKERHIIERVFFGGVSLAQAGEEIGLTAAQVKYVKNKALERLKEIVLESDEVRALLAASD